MKFYQIFVKHIFEPEWEDMGIFSGNSMYDKEIKDDANRCMFRYYEKLADKYELPNISDIIDMAEYFTEQNCLENKSLYNKINDIYRQYLESVMKYKVVELEEEGE